MSRPWISEQTQAEVRQRAKGLCEYCHASEQWQYVQFGMTPTGRATIEALALNRERILGIRAADYEIGRHPPPEDISPIDPN